MMVTIISIKCPYDSSSNEKINTGNVTKNRKIINVITSKDQEKLTKMLWHNRSVIFFVILSLYSNVVVRLLVQWALAPS